MASHCIGLDIGSTAIKLVQLRTGRAGLSLENFGVAPVPVGAIVGGMVQQPALVVAALRELTARISLRGTDVLGAVTQATPAGRLATPDDVADLVAFLCSPAACMIRGQTIVIDGGSILPMQGVAEENG